MELIVRARRRLSKLDTCAIMAPQAGRNPAFPISSATLPPATPTKLGDGSAPPTVSASTDASSEAVVGVALLPVARSGVAR